MSPRIVSRPTDNIAADANDPKGWPYNRYRCVAMYSTDAVMRNYRSTMAATMMVGPLVLARARRAGATADQIYSDDTVNGLNCKLKLTPRDSELCWGAWDAEIIHDGKVVKSFPVCDFQSAADSHYGGPTGNTFSVWV